MEFYDEVLYESKVLMVYVNNVDEHDLRMVYVVDSCL
jgi:hypothetical protein